MNFPFAGHRAGKQVLTKFNGAREVARRDQAMMYYGIHPRQGPCAVIPLAGICAGGQRVTSVPTATEFLNEILEFDYPIVDVEISNTYQPPKLDGLKETSLDVKAKDTQQREFLVEMQVEREAWFCKRAMYYSSKSYSQQLGVGEKYHLLKPVIFLGILDFCTFEHESPFSRYLLSITRLKPPALAGQL